jgi:hypothetical protein
MDVKQKINYWSLHAVSSSFLFEDNNIVGSARQDVAEFFQRE